MDLRAHKRWINALTFVVHNRDSIKGIFPIPKVMNRPGQRQSHIPI